MQGWISLHRKIRCHPFYKERRKFSKFEAWIDMLLEANHADNEWIAGNEIIPVERGSFVTSELNLMERWKWSKTKLRAFLKLLQDEKMIVKKSDSKKTTIYIINYDNYQGEGTAEKPQKDRKKTAKKLQKDTNNNVNNVNTVNKKDIEAKIQLTEYVKMTSDQHQKLITEHGERATAKMIEMLDNYKGAKGKIYKCDYRAILNWVVKKYYEEYPPGQPQPKEKKALTEEEKQKIKLLNEQLQKTREGK